MKKEIDTTNTDFNISDNTISLMPHNYQPGNCTILSYEGLYDNQIARDDEYFEIISIEIPNDSLKSEGIFKLGWPNCIPVIITSSSIQWKDSFLGNPITGNLKYKFKDDSTLQVRIQMDINWIPINSKKLSFENKFDKDLIFAKTDVDWKPFIPKHPCPKMQ